MKEVIAFCSQLPKHEEEFWLTEISHLMANFSIIPVKQLSAKQKEHIKVAIVANPDPQELSKLINLQWVQSLWSGVERLLAELKSDNINIVRMIDPKLSNIMAEAVLAWTLYLHRDMPTYRHQQTLCQWHQHEYIDAEDRRVSILGLGVLGSAAANKLLANGFKVNGWSRNLSKIKGVNCYHGEDGFTNMLKSTDILICLLPLTQETTGLLNRKNLALLPKSASLINFSRGQVVVDNDLLYCLENNQLKHAVLDVFHQEPLDKTHPFWLSEKVTVLPHISAPTSKKTAAKLVANNIINFFNTGKIPKSVDRIKGY